MVVTRHMAKQKLENTKQHKKQQKNSQCVVSIVKLSSQEMEKLKKTRPLLPSTKPGSKSTKKNGKIRESTEQQASSSNVADVKTQKTTEPHVSSLNVHKKLKPESKSSKKYAKIRESTEQQASSSNVYNLRDRSSSQTIASKSEVKHSNEKQDNRIVRMDRPCASKLWEDLKKSRLSIKLNFIVLAKMRTYSPWPAKVVAFKNQDALVFFLVQKIMVKLKLMNWFDLMTV